MVGPASRILPLFLLASFWPPASAHPPAAPAAAATDDGLRVEPLTEQVYCIHGRGGNVGILVTDEGVLIVDDQFPDLAEEVVRRIRRITERPIRYVVNTHHHRDHTGGNGLFADFAEIIAHENVRRRLVGFPPIARRLLPAERDRIRAVISGIGDPEDPYRKALEEEAGRLEMFLSLIEQDAAEPAIAPGVTYEGRLTIWLGGQRIVVSHSGPGHTDGDSVVFFPEQKVLHMGDLFVNGRIPFIDARAGGRLDGYIESIDRAMEEVPADTIVIPGHGEVTDVAGMRRLRDFLDALRGKVGKAVRSGMSRGDTVRAIKMDEYPGFSREREAIGRLVMVAYDELKARR